MKSKTTLSLLFLLFIIILFLSSCADVKKQEPEGYLGLDAVKSGFFRNGKIIYSTSNPDVSMFGTDERIGIRIFKQDGDTSSEYYAYMDFKTISDEELTFELIRFTSESSKTVNIVSLGKGQEYDINSDSIWDIKWTGNKFIESVSARNIDSAYYIELNSGFDFNVTFRTIPKDTVIESSILTIRDYDKFVICTNCLDVVKAFDDTDSTMEIARNSLKFSTRSGDYVLMNSTITYDRFPIMEIESVDIVDDKAVFTLDELTNEEINEFLRGTKYRSMTGENPDEPYLVFPRGSDNKTVIWEGRMNHTSTSGDSVIKIYSENPVQITLEYMDIDFEMNLDNSLRRFFYHPIFGICGDFTIEVDSRERNIDRVPIISEPVFVEGPAIPLYGDVTFGFSAQSEGEGRIKSKITYSLDETYYSIRIDSQDWTNESEWTPQGDFRRSMTIDSATGVISEDVVSITPYLHVDCSLSFMDIFHSQHNDLKIGMKFDSFTKEMENHLDVLPSFEIDSQYAVEYLKVPQCSFPYKTIYSVELSPYIIH
jgi:hypothetical protein